MTNCKMTKYTVTIEFETNSDHDTVEEIAEDMKVQLETLQDDYDFDVENINMKLTEEVT